MADYQSTAPTTIPLTVAEAKAQLNVSSTADDLLISDYINAATVMLEKRCRRAFVTQTRKCLMDTFGDTRYVHDRRAYLPVSPVKSVTSITYVDTNGTTTTMPSSDYVVSAYDKPGFVAEAYDATWPVTYGTPNDVTITYVAGHSTVSTGIPKYVKQAVRMVVGHWYRNRESVLVGTISKEIEMGVDALLEPERMEEYS